tara:strand:+ start:4513 stop:5649 length:1137 start_codon:yes stop_codon:yes gene_type:complete
MATFRTGADGRAVISSGNRVGASGLTPNERAAREASYTSYEPPAVQASNRNRDREADYQNFLRDTGRTATNPYGSEGLFSRAFGISPDKLDYSGITPGGIGTLEQVNRLAFDQFMNPRDARGNIRGMLREGSPTRYGPVGFDPSQVSGIFNRRSGLTIFPEDYGDLGNELGDLSFLTSSLSSPGAEDADAPATTTFSDVFEPFTTDPDVRNPESYFAGINTRPQETPVTPGFTRPDDATMPSVADVIAAEPMVTEPGPEQVVAGSVLVNPGESIIPVQETENERIMRERQEKFDAMMRRRQEEHEAFLERMKSLDEILERGDTVLTPGVRAGATEPLASNLLSPQNIREVFRMPGSSYYDNRPSPINIIPESLLAGSR